MDQRDKAIKVDGALRMLRNELQPEPRQAQIVAVIGDFLTKSTDATKAKLYDLINACESKDEALNRLGQ